MMIEGSVVLGQAPDKPQAIWSNASFDLPGLSVHKEIQWCSRGLDNLPNDMMGMLKVEVKEVFQHSMMNIWWRELTFPSKIFAKHLLALANVWATVCMSLTKKNIKKSI